MLFFKKKFKKINAPKHIAIIMDGNSRWAKSKSLPLKVGHKAGSQNVRIISEACIDLGVKFLTLYAFSSENWDRPKEEVEYLMNLLEEYLEKETLPLKEKGVKIIISGNLSKVSDKIKSKINQIQEETKNNDTLTLNVAFSYGARQEIVDATKQIALATIQNKININDIDEEFFAKNLYHAEIPNPDLLIRTAGDFRLSNFLLWQLAYSEFYFTKINWPDFNKKDLEEAIFEFNKRERRYGKR